MGTQRKLNSHLWYNLMRLKLMNKADAPVRFVLERSPFSDYEEEEIDDQTYLEKDEYLIIGQIFPKSELYKDGIIKIEMIVTSAYPNEPPRVRFLTPIYHPNIEKDGTFCHQLISHRSRWNKATTLVEVVAAVVKHLDEPDADYAISYEAGREYVHHPDEFKRKAKASVERTKLFANESQASCNHSNAAPAEIPNKVSETTDTEKELAEASMDITFNTGADGTIADPKQSELNSDLDTDDNRCTDLNTTSQADPSSNNNADKNADHSACHIGSAQSSPPDFNVKDDTMDSDETKDTKNATQTMGTSRAPDDDAAACVIL